MPMWSDNNMEGPSWMNEDNAPMQGLEEMSVYEDSVGECEINEDESVGMVGEEGMEDTCNESKYHFDSKRGATIATANDVVRFDFKSLAPYDFRHVEFASLDLAYLFYYWFAKSNGFAARKSKLLRNSKGEKLQQTFVCNQEGFRKDRGLNMEDRVREPKAETRCGCESKFRVHIDINSGLWYITYFVDVHNHALLEPKYIGMLPAHRKLSESDILQLNNMKKVGISTPYIYGTIAYQSGVYERCGFHRKDLYNQSRRQKRAHGLDSRCALQYLSGLGENDPLMFVRHTIDKDNRLEHMLWCDGTMQLDYKLFGDVLAFDATYGKNKNQCPLALVIFSDVNHHNQIVVFGSAIVSNETEETYVWILERFLEAMKGKTPVSVITDGDLAMKNAIRKVFPNAHHRLCAWHLLRNATSNIKNPGFTSQFRKCMLGDFEIGEFRRRWSEMVDKFEVRENPWVIELFDKRKMWCTTYIRGQFFAGFRTTSRCEGLHSEIGKYVKPKYDLMDFVQHFYRCLNFMQYKEVEADFVSIHGDPVLQTHYESLEKSGAKWFTREIFFLYWAALGKSASFNVTGSKGTFNYVSYAVSKYQVAKKRWTKAAKDDIKGNSSDLSKFWDAQREARYLSLMEYYKHISVIASENFEKYDNKRVKLVDELKELQSLSVSQSEEDISFMKKVEVVKNPSKAKTKGRSKGQSLSSRGGRPRRTVTCSSCKHSGHNRRSRPTIAKFGEMAKSATGVHFPIVEDDVSFENEEFNVDYGEEEDQNGD